LLLWPPLVTGKKFPSAIADSCLKTFKTYKALKLTRLEKLKERKNILAITVDAAESNNLKLTF